MRDRLMKLLENVKFNPFDQFNIENNLNRIIDVLLANGVIVLPCKVGDIVYAKYSGTNEIEYYVIDKVIHNGSNSFDFEAHLENEDGYVVDTLEFGSVDIGIIVFLTKEEAEQALRKDEGK